MVFIKEGKLSYLSIDDQDIDDCLALVKDSHKCTVLAQKEAISRLDNISRQFFESHYTWYNVASL
jgi:hypothetical protein